MTPISRYPPRISVILVAAVGGLLFGLFVFGASQRSGEVREWTPADHDQPPGQLRPERSKALQPKVRDSDDLVELAWTKNCASCHGKDGRGDGPQASMFKAPDLTRADWQARVTDEEIATTIRKGRNKMPAFELSSDVVQGLVRRIRASR